MSSKCIKIFLTRTRINVIGFDNIVGIDQVEIMWIGTDSGGNCFGWKLIGWDLIGWDLIWVGNDRVGIVRGLELNGSH